MTSINTPLSMIGDAYVNFAEEFYNNTAAYDLTPLLDYLPDLTLEDNYVLEDFRPREQTNSVLRLYVRDKETKRPQSDDYKHEKDNFFYVLGGSSNSCYVTKSIKIAGIPVFRYKKKFKPINPFLHISLPFTEEAVWQAYLLQRTYHIIGMRWHGGYAARLFINLPDDVEKIRNTHNVARTKDNCDLEKLATACRAAYLPPVVKLMKNKATVTHCWFDDWHGLIRVVWEVEYNKRKRQIGEFKIMEEKVLVKYNCGIKY